MPKTLLLYGVIILFGPSCSEPKPINEDADRERNRYDTALDDGRRYLEDAVFRREALETSLVNPMNRYAKTRLKWYTDEEWGALPVWNPRIRPVVPSDIGAERPKPDFTWESLDIPAEWDKATLLELGARTFTTFPAQLEPAMLAALADPSGPSRYGLWQTEKSVGGLLWVELPDGVLPALSCATCHATIDDNGEMVWGVPNAAFDLGRAIDEFRRARTPNSAWGPGRVDITGDGVFNPTVIADLRAVRFQTHLQRAATIRNSLIALAIRLETNSISITGRAGRAPREAMFATAFFLFELGTLLPEPPSGPGRTVFDGHCAACHAPPGLSGDPTAISEVGTDPAIGQSPYRTTGAYQTTSLRGVSNRKMLTASGAIPSLESLLSPERATPGHAYGLTLSENERADLLDFLKAL